MSDFFEMAQMVAKACRTPEGLAGFLAGLEALEPRKPEPVNDNPKSPDAA